MTSPRQLYIYGLSLAIVPLLALPALGISKKGSEQAGANLFHDKGCAYCHGINAAGTQKGPNLADASKHWKPAQLTDQIENGGQKMPAFKDSLSNDEVAQLVAFLRAKHRPASQTAPAPVTSTPVTSAPASPPAAQN